jgi:hypothetical protein
MSKYVCRRKSDEHYLDSRGMFVRPLIMAKLFDSPAEALDAAQARAKAIGSTWPAVEHLYDMPAVTVSAADPGDWTQWTLVT